MGADDRLQTARKRHGHVDPVRRGGLLFVPALQVEDVLYLSGELPFLGGEIPDRFRGKIGGEGGMGLETAQEAAAVATLNLLFTAQSALGKLDNAGQVIEAFGFVNCAGGFVQQSQVMNGCSSLLWEVFGQEKGRHTRCVVGVAELPLDACIEIKLILHVDCVGLPNDPAELRGKP